MKKTAKQSVWRSIPAVERVLQALGDKALPRAIVLAVVRAELASWRKPSQTNIPGFEEILHRIDLTLEGLRAARIQPVINGTGILIHTNLGRAPLGEEVVETLCRVGCAYNNLEFDLRTGERGERAVYLEQNLALVCGAQAATVVNNCAAALVLIVRHFITHKPEVVISRGELVQIGGGFRIPEILEASGARLREVGTTNKTSLADYARAIGSETALVLKVHRSNFFMEGFVEAPTRAELVQLARKKRVPFVEDLGSGAVVDTERLAEVEHEPTPREVLRQGVDLVCFSGDKLLGGPQAGIIAGRRPWVSALKKEPLFRALRCDKLILSALQATVDGYLDSQIGEVEAARLPVFGMMQLPKSSMEERAQRMIAALQDLPLQARAGTGKAQLGGGTLPRSRMVSVTVDLQPAEMTLAQFSARLRTGNPPVVGYISGGWFKLDLRTVFSRQDEELLQAVRRACHVADTGHT